VTRQRPHDILGEDRLEKLGEFTRRVGQRLGNDPMVSLLGKRVGHDSSSFAERGQPEEFVDRPVVPKTRGYTDRSIKVKAADMGAGT
jgi:hypothetical protein